MIVEIDESLLVKAKYNCGHQLTKQQRWVFGVYNPATNEGYIELVEDRMAETLLGIIKEVVAPVTKIWSDEWRDYRQLEAMGMSYTHRTVNHSRHFCDLETGTCTNHVEAYWNAVKRRFKKMFGTAGEMVPSYLDEHTWREWHGRTGHLSVNIMRLIAACYHVE